MKRSRMGRKLKSPDEKLHTISVQLTIPEKEALEAIAKDQERSSSYVARFAIRALIEQAGRAGTPAQRASATSFKAGRRP